MSIRLHTYNLKAASEKPTAQDMAVLTEADYAGPDADAAGLIVRRMLLCHDQYDRTFERFPKDYLARFAETLPGKSVLPGHDTSALPLARFHAAKVSRVDEPEFPVLVTRERKSVEVIAGFETRAARVSYLDARFYYVAADTLLDEKIKAGTYRAVSIGFRYDDVQCDLCKKSYFSDCPHLAGRWSEDGKLATLTYSGDAEKAEALEGSIVYLGAQPQARIAKQAASMVQLGAVDPDALAAVPFYGEPDLVTLKWAEDLARTHGHQRKHWHFAATVAEGVVPEASGTEETDSMDFLKRLAKALDLDEAATEDQVVSEVEAAKSDSDGRVKATVEASKAVADAALATEKAAKREPLATVGEKALKDLRDTILADDLKLNGKESTELAEITEHHVSTSNYDRLKALAAEKREAVFAKWPTGISGDPAAGRAEEEAAAKPQRRAGEFQLG